MNYTCRLTTDHHTVTWTGILELIRHHHDYCEAYAEARGSGFHIIVGEYDAGHYLFEPYHNFGCKLASLDNIAWNLEQIQKKSNLCPVDAESLVTAISHLPELYKDRNM